MTMFGRAGVPVRDHPAASERDPAWREDMVGAVLGAVLVVGLFLDGWNHINLQDGALGSFFTPWHAVLYAGFTATTGWVLVRNAHLFGPRVRARPQYHQYLGLPLRYPFALFGFVIASFGMVGDIVWHTVFGDETGVARVIAPFHLVLFCGAVLLLAAPLRSGWYARDVYPDVPTFRQVFPPLLSLTLVTASIAFMFQWLSAFIEWEPSLTLGHLPAEFARDPRIVGTAEFAGVARVLITNLILMAPVLLALRRWRLPPGSVTFLFTGVAVAMATLTEFRLGWSVVAAVIGGLAADTFIVALKPSEERASAHRAVAAGTAAALWTAYFVTLRIAYDTRWRSDLWVGTVGLCVISAVVLSFLTMPPAALPRTWGETEAARAVQPTVKPR